MTVGISLTNWKETVVVTDQQVSSSGRKSDSLRKNGVIIRPEYHGVLFGAGSGNTVIGMIDRLPQFDSKSLENLASSIHVAYRDEQEKIDGALITEEKKIIMEKAKAIDDEKERKQFVDSQLGLVFGRFDQLKREGRYSSRFIIVGYNHEENKINQIAIEDSGHFPVKFAHAEIGSGDDGSQMYFAQKLQGVNTGRLAVHDLALLALNAYGNASTNRGVGGQPSIVIVNKEGVTELDRKKTLLLVNVSGAYLAEIKPELLTIPRLRKYFANVMNSEGFEDRVVTDATGKSLDDLTTFYTPYSSWQDAASQKNWGDLSQ